MAIQDERPTIGVESSSEALNRAIEDALRDASRKGTLKTLKVVDGHATLEFDLRIRVKMDIPSNESLGPAEDLVPLRMGQICCRCAIYENGSWFCAGTCC
jgi:hypothetical protein